VTAQIDLDDLAGARFDLDPVGHYSRNDLFTLSVDETPRSGVEFIRHDLG
jgi:nitrilase